MSGESKKVILLVDDTPANIQIAMAILKDLYQVRVATNGAKALELAAADPPPDLILLDVMMPASMASKYARAEGLAGNARHTGDLSHRAAEIEEETRGFEVGGVDYIHKPFSPAVMTARVHTHLVLRGIRERLAQQLGQ